MLRLRWSLCCLLLALIAAIVLPISVASEPSPDVEFQGSAEDNSAAAAPPPSDAPAASSLKDAPLHSLPPLPLTKERLGVLVDAGLLPHVVPLAPPSVLKLSFGADALRLAELGATLAPPTTMLAQVAERPRLNYNVHANKYYAVVMVDPDAPSRSHPESAQWLHWLVANIPGRDTSRGDLLVEYAPPTPPRGTGVHRYVFLLFEQGKHWDVDSVRRIARNEMDGRAKWSWERFLQQQNDATAKLQAINFFRAEYDETTAAAAATTTE